MLAKQPKRKGEQCVTVTLPELLQLEKLAKQLIFPASQLSHSRSGQHLSRFLGRGMEFAESRRYQPGDDIRAIDWRVTARTGKPHTKLFAAEKERQVLLCVDMRSPMFFATRGLFKSVQAALIAGYVSWNAVQTGNRLGGIIFDDQTLFESRPALGKRGILPFLNGVAERARFVAKEKDSSLHRDGSILDHALENLRRVAKPGSLLFIISDFRRFSDYAEEQLLQLSKHHTLSLCFTYDALEKDLPGNGSYSVTNGKSKLEVSSQDKAALGTYQQRFFERRNRVAGLSNQHHLNFIECSTENDCFELLHQHFS